VKEIRTLILLGGTWHNFDAFAEYARTQLDPLGCRIECTRDLQRLETLTGLDLVIKYTCFSASLEDGKPAPVRFTDAHAEALAQWVAAGGALLGVHSATVAAQSSPRLRKLLGASFVNHPPAFDVTVHPMAANHPVTAGVGVFSGRDEFYIHEMEPDVHVHMGALDRGVAHPMVWTRIEGRGRVAYVAPGHDGHVWSLAPYRRLFAQAAQWSCAR
jgi:type 1 glutamine amidotransferase